MQLKDYAESRLRGVPAGEARVLPAIEDPTGASYVAGWIPDGVSPVFRLNRKVRRLRDRLHAAGLPHAVVPPGARSLWVVRVDHPDEATGSNRLLVALIVREVGLMRLAD